MTGAKEGALIMGNSNLKISLLFTVAAALLLSGCGGARLKARQEQREKLVSSTGLFCEWVNGDKHSDFDVEVNLQMAKRCDSSKPFSLVPFKNTNDENGIMFCCGVAGYDNPPGNASAPAAPRRTTGPVAKKVTAPSNAAAPSGGSAPAPAVNAAPSPAGSDATDLSKDEIVEDK
jgi:hypothetical protein